MDIMHIYKRVLLPQNMKNSKTTRQTCHSIDLQETEDLLYYLLNKVKQQIASSSDQWLMVYNTANTRHETFNQP